MADLFGGMSAPPAPAEPRDDGKMIDLRPLIENPACYARNENVAFPMTNLFVGDSTLGCKSDADEQLIVHIQFNEFVKVGFWIRVARKMFSCFSIASEQIHSIKLTEFNNGIDPESNPSKIHLYKNRENLGFEDCDDVDPTQTLHLTTEHLKSTSDPIPLKFVKFQRVKSLTLFVEDNQGGETTSLGGIKLFGRPVGTTNMNDFKKKQDE